MNKLKPEVKCTIWYHTDRRRLKSVNSRSVCIFGYSYPNVYYGEPVVRGVRIRRVIQESICDFSKERDFTRSLTGLSKVHTHVVSATTHLTTATTFYRKLRKRDLYLPFQECIVKVAIALARDIRSLETFWEVAVKVTCSAVLKIS